MTELMLSICVTTYGHEKYIARALDSILMQKTKYSFEVLVGEDLSPDHTREILKQYEESYPGFFTMFYREHNMNKEEVWNALDLRNRAKGKYIINLEGDDYWTDPLKLEKQITFLEEHPDYIAVAHNCVVVDENSLPNGENYPECKDEEYTLDHFLGNILPGQFATVMYRNRPDGLEDHILKKRCLTGDRAIYFALISSGKIHCMQENMSAYRHIVKGGHSYSANQAYQFAALEGMYREMIIHAELTGNRKAVQCAEAMYLATVITGFRKKSISLKQAVSYIRGLSGALTAGYNLLKRSVIRRRYRAVNKNLIF